MGKKTIILSEEQLLTMINESLSSQVYHWTSISTAYKILHTDRMFCQSSIVGGGADDMNSKYKFYISMTRNKTSYEGFATNYNKNAARIEFDGNLLRNNFAGGPVNYWGAHDLLNKYTYMRRAAGVKDGDNYVYKEIDSLPQGAVASNRKEWMSYPTANSPEYIKVGNQYYHKENEKRNIDRQIEFAYKPIHQIPQGTNPKPIDKFEFKYPSENSPEYTSYDNQIYHKEQVIPQEIQHHHDNEIEDRLITNKPYIDEVRKYIKRVDIIIGDFESLPDELKRYVYKLSFISRCFIYNDEKDFNKQSENIINKQIQDIEDGWGKYGKVLQDDRIGGITSPLAKFLALITIPIPDRNEKNKIAGTLLRQNNFTKYIRSIIREMSRIYGNPTMIVSELTAELQNLSKSPTEDGQLALGFITKIFKQKGYKNWRDAISKITAECDKRGHEFDNIDVQSKLTRNIMVVNEYQQFDITNDNDTNFWYIFGLNTKQERYYFVESLLDNVRYATNGNWEQEGEWINNVRDNSKIKFQKYLQNLAHKKVTLQQMFNLINKIGYSTEQLLSDFGWQVEYKQEQLDYWQYTWSSIYPPFKGKEEYPSENRDAYAKVIFRKDNQL